jgi:hypothetical protein
MGILTSRPVRLALVASITALALLASATRLRPSTAAAAGCVSLTLDGAPVTAAYYNPLTVSGTVDASACDYGVAFDSADTNATGTINSATIFGAKTSDGVILYETHAIVTIKNSLIRNNARDGVSVYNSVLASMFNTKVSANGADGVSIATGGGVGGPSASTANIHFSSILNNTGTHPGSRGDGVLATSGEFDTTNLEIDNTLISGNAHNGIEATAIRPLNLTNDNVIQNGFSGLVINPPSPLPLPIAPSVVLATGTNFSLNGMDGLDIGEGANVFMFSSKATSNRQAGALLEPPCIPFAASSIQSQLEECCLTVASSGVRSASFTCCPVASSSIKQQVCPLSAIQPTFPTLPSFLHMDRSSAMYNRIGIDIEDTQPGTTPAAVSLTHYSRACSNSVVDVETVASPANWSADATSQICTSRTG